MKLEEAEIYQRELIETIIQLELGKNLESLSCVVRNRIDELNTLIDIELSNKTENDYQVLIALCYQYYRLLYK